MKAFFNDLFAYHHDINQKLIKQIMENSQQVSDRTIPLFSHAINAHQIWNARILNITTMGVFEVHTLEKCMQLDTENYAQTIRIIDLYEMSQVISYKDSKGGAYQNSVKEILYHVGNHFTHHRGQLVSDLRQNGIPPIVTDYIFYKR